MLDLPNAKVRRKLGCHASFKGDVFRRLTKTQLFIESDSDQAKIISKLSGKHVLCFGTQEFFSPDLSIAQIQNKTRSLAHRIVGKVARETKKIISNG